jgi:hypothetical protein
MENNSSIKTIRDCKKACTGLESSGTLTFEKTRPNWFTGGRMYRLKYLTSSAWHSRKTPFYNYNPEWVRVFLVSRDIYSCLDSLVGMCISTGISPENIFIIDQGTTNEVCKSAYLYWRSQGVNVLSVPRESEALGPYVVWLDASLVALREQIDYPYIVSDTDLQFPNHYPEGWLERMFYALNEYRLLSKIALPLKVTDIDVDSRDIILNHERSLGSSTVYSLLQYFSKPPSATRVCQTDTTFSLYRPGHDFSTISLRLEADYALHHMPWYRSFIETQEYKFYQRNKRPEFGMWS